MVILSILTLVVFGIFTGRGLSAEFNVTVEYSRILSIFFKLCAAKTINSDLNSSGKQKFGSDFSCCLPANGFTESMQHIW